MSDIYKLAFSSEDLSSRLERLPQDQKTRNTLLDLLDRLLRTCRDKQNCSPCAESLHRCFYSLVSEMPVTAKNRGNALPDNIEDTLCQKGKELFLVRQFIQTHGGRFWIACKQPPTFCFTIPYKRKEGGVYFDQ